MVYIVEKSFHNHGYRETNQELAREVGDLRQQLGTVYQQYHTSQAEIQTKNVRIAELEVKLKDLEVRNAERDAKLAKYDAICKIINNDKIDETYETRTQTQLESSHTQNETTRLENSDNELEEEEEDKTLDEDSTDENDITANQDEIQDENQQESGLQPIHEVEDENTTQNETITQHEATHRGQSPCINDSLEPADVTSVPSINHQERTIHTPSIWNCLDSLDSDTPRPKSRDSEMSSPKSIASPSTSNNNNTGLRQSNCIVSTSTSPIRPIARELQRNLNANVFHSTPVTQNHTQLDPNISAIQCNQKRSLSDPNPSIIIRQPLDDVGTDNEQRVCETFALKGSKRGHNQRQPVRRAVEFGSNSKEKDIDGNGRQQQQQVEIEQQAAQAEPSPQAAAAAVAPPPPPSPLRPTRYNLRKRAKV